MERISALSSASDLKKQLATHTAQLLWEFHRVRRNFNRRFGALGWISFLAITLCALLAWHESHLQEKNNALREQIHALELQKKQNQNTEPLSVEETKANGHTRLLEFDKRLLPHKDIPALINFMLLNAEEMGLSINHADYRPELDEAGGFMRLRINLPIRGSAEAIDRYLITVLHTQTALALANVQFKREAPDSPILELQTQWVAFTQQAKDGPDYTLPVDADIGVKP